MLKHSWSYGNLGLATKPALMKRTFQTALSAVWERPVWVRRLAIPRVLLVGQGRLLVQYQLSTVEKSGLQDRVLFGHLLAPDESLPEGTGKPEVLVLPQFRMVAPVFPFDRGLKTLERFFKPEDSSELLNNIPEGILEGTSARLEKVDTLAYRPERRAVLRVRFNQQGRSKTVIARLGQPAKVESYYSKLQLLERAGFQPHAQDGITAPRALGCLPEGILWQEDVPDPSLYDLYGKDRFVAGCAVAGHTLNKLHGAPIDGLPAHTVDDELELLGRFTNRIGEIYPRISEPLERLFGWIEARSPVGYKSNAVPVHRDFYDKQVLIGTQRTTLLDVDTLAMGDPALDVGNFLAHLTLRSRQFPQHSQPIAVGRRGFLAAYRSGDDSFWQRARWWEFAALLRLVCVYSLRPRWQRMAMRLMGGLEEEATAATASTWPSPVLFRPEKSTNN